MLRRLVVLASWWLTAMTVSAAPALAISDGVPARLADYPWFANIGDDECGGVLVAADRVITAVNCVEYAEGYRVRIGDVRRRATGIALHPAVVARLVGAWQDSCHGWETEPVCVPDIALVRLSAPVRGVPPPDLIHARVGWHATVVGHGTRSLSDDETAPARLRAAWLEVMSDAACRARYRRLGHRQFLNMPAKDTFCGRDPTLPHDAGICIGDGGAPLLVQRAGGWGLLGIGSWASLCGEGNRPTVFTDVWRHRAFIRSTRPTWRPTTAGRPRLTGTGRVGDALTCRGPRFTGRVDRIVYSFEREIQPPKTFQRGAASTYIVQERDRGEDIVCSVLAANAGGVATALSDPVHTE